MSSNTRIAKNAMMLYFRMFLSMVVGFYTSRVVLATLGVEDYGIYGVVGGVVAMFGFMNAAMGTATARFIAYESGRGDFKRLNETFVSASYIHWLIAAIVLVLAETVGLWFLANKLVIPPERMTAAHWVYQLSIVSTMLGISQVPYSSVIVAHEKMDIYAYFELLSVVLKLLIVYLLVIGSFDKLVLYAVLNLCVSVFMRFLWRFYCIHHYPESKLHFVWRPEILRPMLTFSGWNLYSSVCVIARQQGINFVINIFFGVLYNAASSVATTVQGLVKSFTSNITFAFQPHIIKLYAAGEYEQMQSSLRNLIVLALVAIMVITLPLLAELDYLFVLWLVHPPEHATQFCAVLLLSAPFALLNNIFYIPIQAAGNIRFTSVISGTMFLLCLPTTYIFYRCGFEAVYAYYSILTANMLILTSNIIITHRLVKQLNVARLVYPIAVAAGIFIVVLFGLRCFQRVAEPSFVRFIAITFASTMACLVLSYVFILDRVQRKLVAVKIKEYTNRFKR